MRFSNQRRVGIKSFSLGLALAAALALSSPCAVAEPVDFSIPAGDAAQTLRNFGAQARMQILFVSGAVEKHSTRAVSGQLEPRDALARLLDGTGLTFEFVNERTVAVKAAAEAAATDAGAGMRVAQAGNAPAHSGATTLAQADSTQSTQKAVSSSTDNKVEEIIVSAQKTSQRIQDVPVPVSVIDTNALASTNQVLMRDYLQTVPSVHLAPGVQGVQTLAIRGITTGTGNPTVAVMIDGVPYSSATNGGGGRIIPDVDPGDLARVEVLRGPQGTLYGATSLGGLLSFVTHDPSTDRLSGELQAGTTSVAHGESLGSNFRGFVNAPITDTLAVRVSGFSRHDPGFLDDPGQGREAINSGTSYGGRASVMWTPSDTISVKLSGLDQRVEMDSSQTSDIGLDLQQIRLRGSGSNVRRSQFYSGTFSAKLGRGEFTSLSGYSKTGLDDNGDVRPGTTATTNGSRTRVDAKKFVQELRFAAPVTERLDVLVGAFYTDEDSTILLDTPTIDRLTGVTTGRAGGADLFAKYEEYAAFADLTVHVTDRLDVQLGARTSDIKQTSAGNDANHIPIPAQDLKSKFTPFSYLLTPSFKLSESLMAYARFASGFRTGGPNLRGPGVPLDFEPDETRTYEVGLKGDFFDRALSVDASVYYIDWTKVQFNLVLVQAPPLTNITYTNNGSSAKSEGVELAATWRPIRDLTIDGWVTVGRAELTESFPPGATALGLPGFRTPYSSEFSGHLSLRKGFAITADVDGFVSGTFNYIGDRLGPFQPQVVGSQPPTSIRAIYPSYTQSDLSFGATRGTWTGTVFVNNLEDTRGQINGGAGVAPTAAPGALVYITPRTVGLSLAKSF